MNKPELTRQDFKNGLGVWIRFTPAAIEGIEALVARETFVPPIKKRLAAENLLQHPDKQDSPCVYGIGLDNWRLIHILVSDVGKALPVLKAELENLKILPFCHIAHWDSEQKVWRTWFPENTTIPFELHCDFLKSIMDKQKAAVMEWLEDENPL